MLNPALLNLPSTSYHFTEVEGLNVFYRSAGDPCAPTIVLLHGFPSSSHMFRDLIPLLADRFHVIAPDYIGFGYSDAPSAQEFEYSFRHLTEIVQSLLGKFGIEAYYLYMQDYGGPIGLRLATAHPERVLGLVFQNANVYMEGVSQAAADVFMPLWLRGDETGARQMLLAQTTRFQYTQGARNSASLNPDAWTHDQALLDRPGSADRQMALFKDYQTNVALYEEWQAYFRQRQPKSLVAWGKGDPFFGVPGAEAFKRDLTNLEVHYFDAGHFALEEDCPAIAALIKRYF
ncbi:alpha/beta fold hydrolase [Polaromonas sp. JS666]|uniref:alpha/beta fold hydrolase n=1 Tax=Polaromonas sp. (strain JS666 / ATCC BAA-500) TaxID=296591 RepID=UPI0000535C56|nr:alpha/beta hydrolase [Polaromonas sp. JS666]ABE42484.1 alpha/beta hydrolase fold protein [Polaromonas sp. JS666]